MRQTQQFRTSNPLSTPPYDIAPVLVTNDLGFVWDTVDVRTGQRVKRCINSNNANTFGLPSSPEGTTDTVETNRETTMYYREGKRLQELCTRVQLLAR